MNKKIDGLGSAYEKGLQRLDLEDKTEENLLGSAMNKGLERLGYDEGEIKNLETFLSTKNKISGIKEEIGILKDRSKEAKTEEEKQEIENEIYEASNKAYEIVNEFDHVLSSDEKIEKAIKEKKDKEFIEKIESSNYKDEMIEKKKEFKLLIDKVDKKRIEIAKKIKEQGKGWGIIANVFKNKELKKQLDDLHSAKGYLEGWMDFVSSSVDEGKIDDNTYNIISDGFENMIEDLSVDI